MITGTEPAHRLLELLLTKAAVSGKARSSRVSIPYAVLAKSIGLEPKHDADLLIEFLLSWQEPAEFSDIPEEFDNPDAMPDDDDMLYEDPEDDNGEN